jgi:hypothetical protein
MRSHLAKIIAGLGVTSSCIACSLQAGASSNRSEKPIATDSGVQILAVALRNAQREGSCTSFTSSVIAGQSYGDLTNSGPKKGEQFISYGDASTDIRLLKGIVYVKANDGGIVAQFGVSDPKLANKWIKVTSSSSHYSVFSDAIAFASMLKKVPPIGTLKVTPQSKIGKRAVVGVTGEPNSELGFSTGVETLYVSTSFPYVPVELTVSGVSMAHASDFRMTFSNWGSQIEVVEPATSTPISDTKLSK